MVSTGVQHVCATPARPGVMSCMALVRTNVAERTQAQIGPNAAPVGFGYGPADLQSAYQLPSSTAGAGQTVAVVDAFDYPTAAADLANYRSSWGLPACNASTGAGCLTKVNENGQASPLPAPSGTGAAATGWATEAALDIDMVSAACPLCKIILVEANQPTLADLGAGVNAAVNLGAKFVSNSYGGSESSTDPASDTSFYRHAGVAVTASSGDSGFAAGVSFPSGAPDVVAVGGTSLTRASNARGWTETVWSGAGSGCSAVEAKPAFQHDTGCTRRTDNDVAAVADPNTGVAVFDTYDQGGWLQVGGTSVSSPLIAAVYALAGTPTAGTFPNSYPYAHVSSLNDVTSGTNGCRRRTVRYLCTGVVGYDGPTGFGTPIGTAAFHQ
jgi:subtilase family serine protease